MENNWKGKERMSNDSLRDKLPVLKLGGGEAGQRLNRMETSLRSPRRRPTSILIMALGRAEEDYTQQVSSK